MPKQKYNRTQIKADFMQSDIPEVKSFFQGKFNTYNGEIRKNTIGRTEEKKELQKQSLEEALKEQSKKDKDEWLKVFANMNKARKFSFNDLAKELTSKKMSTKEVLDVLKHFRLELGETTENIKQENKISKEDEDKVQMLLELNVL